MRSGSLNARSVVAAHMMSRSFHLPPSTRRQCLPWAELFQFDVLTCSKCGGCRRVLAYITEPRVVRAILQHLRLPSTAPPIVPARDPPLPPPSGPAPPAPDSAQALTGALIPPRAF